LSPPLIFFGNWMFVSGIQFRFLVYTFECSGGSGSADSVMETLENPTKTAQAIIEPSNHFFIPYNLLSRIIEL
jgi:hypothetical protein